MKDKSRLILLVALALIVLIGMTIGFTLFDNKKSEAVPTEVIPEKPMDTVAPTTTSTEVIPEEESQKESEIQVELVSLVTFKTGTKFADTEVGGLSAITYDTENDLYYVLSDDRSKPHFYTVSIASDGSEVIFEAVTYLVDKSGSNLESGEADPEGIAFASDVLYISSEGDAASYPPVNPAVMAVTLSGQLEETLTIPDAFLPDGYGKWGVRSNKAFESLTLSPDGQYLYTAVENALAQDGPIASLEEESFSRILQLNAASGQPMAEYVYVTGVIPQAPKPAIASADNGLAELIALEEEGTFLALERSYASGVGNTIQLYLADAQNATDVSGMDTLWDKEAEAPLAFTSMEKTLITTLADVGVDADNVEGMTLGPVLDDGTQILVLVSDNNFNNSQVTQFIVLAIDL